MAISFECDCGKSLQVKDELGGKRVRCPACSAAITVPAAETPAWEVVEDEPAPPPVRKAKPRVDDDDDRRDDKRSRRDEDEDDEPRDKKRSRQDDDDEEDARDRRRSRRDEDDDNRPRKKKKKKFKKGKTEKEEHTHFGMEKWIINGGVPGGLLAMIIAVAWFVAGVVYADKYFIYPPILFVVGLIAFFKGLMGGGEE